MSATKDVLDKIRELRNKVNKREAKALANDALIFEHFKPVDISSEVHLCEQAGLNSFNYWQQHKGAQQCVNSIHSSTAGMYGEAVAEKYLTDFGFHVDANWREWIDGEADDTKADLVISGGDEVAIDVEVKTITRATDPKGQVTVKHLEKYAAEDKLVICVRYDEANRVGYVYSIEQAVDIKAYSNKELNLYDQECYVAMVKNHCSSEVNTDVNFKWK
ncbi:TPA: hypothetical protein ACUNCG_000752 [Aeromonas hydrophila]